MRDYIICVRIKSTKRGGARGGLKRLSYENRFGKNFNLRENESIDDVKQWRQFAIKIKSRI